MLKKAWMWCCEFVGGVLIAMTIALTFAIMGAMALEPHPRSKKKR